MAIMICLNSDQCQNAIFVKGKGYEWNKYQTEWGEEQRAKEEARQAQMKKEAAEQQAQREKEKMNKHTIKGVLYRFKI